jgi:hypothetical protein
MRILLQNFETGLYLDTSGAWTSTPELARSFPSTRQAAEFKIQRRLDQALVIVLPEPAPPLDVTGRRDEVTTQTQKPAKPIGRQARVIQAKTTKEDRLAQRKPAMASNHRGLNPYPCHLSV